MTEIIKGLKITLLVQLVVYLIFGVMFTFFVVPYTILFNWPNLDPTAGRTLGVIFLSLALVAILIYREKEWEKVEFFFIFSILMSISISIVQIIGIFVDNTGYAGWINAAISLVFFVSTLFFYIAQVRK